MLIVGREGLVNQLLVVVLEDELPVNEETAFVFGPAAITYDRKMGAVGAEVKVSGKSRLFLPSRKIPLLVAFALPEA